MLSYHKELASVAGIEADAYSKFTMGELDKDIVPDYFYCYWEPKDIFEKLQPKHPNCCFNHKVGLPLLKTADESPGQPSELFGYQHRWIDMYNSSNYYAQNKCRGSGTTEIKVVRYNAWKYMHTKNPKRKCIIIAGINEDMAIKFMNRIKMLCDQI